VKILTKKCVGSYCNIKHSAHSALIDEKFEQDNIYMMEIDPTKRYDVPYKSILLDIVESKKLQQLVLMACPNLTRAKIASLNTGLLMKFRRYYTAYDLKSDNLFKHLTPANLSSTKKVCGFCHSMYRIIDSARTKAANSLNIFLNDPSLIEHEIEKGSNETNLM
jgi:hypothetical protein